MILKYKKVLVTGGAGFIGSHLVDRLIKENCKVAVIDNLSSGKKENLNPRAKFYKQDIRSPKISQIFRKEKPEIVFHYAAQIDFAKSLKEPLKDAETNILGTLNVLEASKKFGVKKFIFASSVGVYGEPKILPLRENHPLNPISPYAVGKLAAEKYLNHYRIEGLDFVILRYANVYGSRQGSTGEGGVVAIFIDKLLKSRKPIVFGRGEQTRDFLYVDDAVTSAFLSLKSPPSSVYNFGTNKEISVNSLLSLISRVSGQTIKPNFRPFRPGEIIKSRVDFSRAKKELNWQPKYSLEEGLKKTLKWFKHKI